MDRFSERVWELTRKVPAGRVTTYKIIAEELGKPAACRAVGQALRRNPKPVVVPCHRVVKSDGGLGGYMGSAKGGLRRKAELLESEGVKVRNGRVCLKASFYRF